MLTEPLACHEGGSVSGSGIASCCKWQRKARGNLHRVLTRRSLCTVQRQLWRRHLWRIEYALRLQLAKKLERNQLFVIPPLRSIHAPLQLSPLTNDFHKQNFSASRFHPSNRILDKTLPHRILRIERKNQPGQGSGLFENRKPDLFPQFNKRFAPKFKNREQQIHRQMVVKQLVCGQLRKFARNRQLSRSRQSVEKNQLHGISSAHIVQSIRDSSRPKTTATRPPRRLTRHQLLL